MAVIDEFARHGTRPDASDPLQAFQDLMPYRVQDVLLVSSLYDSFTLQEDGRLDELILEPFLGLPLEQAPRLRHVSSATEALELAIAERRFNLILTSPDPGDLDAVQLARALRKAGLEVPVVVLAFDNQERKSFVARHDQAEIERVFLWQGDARILLAIVKSVEDRRNALHDSATVGVPVVLVVEDNVRYYSSFLPQIYATLIRQSARVIPEGVNASHRAVRLRARPKILLATTFEEAWELFQVHRPFVLGLISDVEFPRDGHATPEAGFELATRVRELAPDLPILLHSSRETFAARARAAGVSFLRKYSDTLLGELEEFMIEQFAFGDFVFRRPDGTEVGRARDLKELEALLNTVPGDSIAFHGERNHFSNWFTARTEFSLAHKLRPRRVSEFATFEDLRRDLVEAIAEYRREQSESLVADFDARTFDPGAAFFARVGGGSLGGKARGLAFVRFLLAYHGLGRHFPGVKIAVPPSLVLATGCFDRFLDENALREFAFECPDDGRLLRRFLDARLPAAVMNDLRAFLRRVHWPLAVRSSSLLEDSQYLPFTGVYDTCMLPNDDPDFDTRLGELATAIKRVYASTYTQAAKSYLHATPYRLEEERMAVVIQRVVGGRHEERWYPDFSGVARSYDFYPSPTHEADDGVAAVALGMGRAVVEGEQCLTFCPRTPRNIAHFSSVDDILHASQRRFWALVMGPAARAAGAGMRETAFDLDTAERDGTLLAVGSTWSLENQAIYDGLSRAGVRLVTFAPILKHDVFPLAGILTLLLDLGRRGMNRPAEIEFAVRLSPDPHQPHEFGFLQMRPLVVAGGHEDARVDEPDDARLVVRSDRVLGNGRIEMRDVVMVDFAKFERGRSREAAAAVTRFNRELVAEGRPYLLVGVGRWGSTDPWLGIPVAWEQIAGARVIVESGFRDLPVTPSQGSHFFQNLTSFQVGYFTVNEEVGQGFVDWSWLAKQPAEREDGVVRHLVFEQPLVAHLNGRTSRGIVYKPGAAPAE